MITKYVRLGCGLDISKSDFHSCLGYLNQAGEFKVKCTRRFANNTTGIKLFIEWLEKNKNKLDKAHELPFQVLMETTGVYHELVCLSLYKAGLVVCLEIASRVKKYLQSIGQYTKTDKQDAKGICQMACERKFRSWQPCSENILKIRTALRHRKSLINNKVRLSNQLHAIGHSAYSSKETKASIVRLIKLLDKEIVKSQNHIQSLFEADEQLYNRLQPIIDSIKGIGLITALTIVAETNGFSQIRSAKQLASYAGYDIIENQSGNSTRPSRISKRGNARIRQQMYMAAVALINTKSGPIYEFYLRIKQRNPKVYKVANVAVQRKLLLLVFTLFKNNTSYDPLYSQIFQKKNSSEQRPELREIVLA